MQVVRMGVLPVDVAPPFVTAWRCGRRGGGGEVEVEVKGEEELVARGESVSVKD